MTLGSVQDVAEATYAFAWERRAPARLQKPRWSVAFPGNAQARAVDLLAMEQTPEPLR
jgi:hypothetical protein